MATKIVTKNSSTSGSAPLASDLVQGELAVNVTDKRLYTENASGTIVEVGTNPSTLTVTGEITANGGIALGDNDKATFGAGDDLQIYHDGSGSYIDDQGTGPIRIRSGVGGALRFQDLDGDDLINATSNGAVTLYYDNSAKLATTSTGIDVTGTIASSGNLEITSSVPKIILTDSNNPSGQMEMRGANTEFVFDFDPANAENNSQIDFKTDGSRRLLVKSTGIDVTGTATMDGLTVDGVGSFSSSAPYIDLFETDTTDLNSRIVSNSSSLRLQTVADNGSNASNRLLIDHGTGDLSLYENTGTTPKFFWDASAESLGIGTSSPSATLEVDNGAEGEYFIAGGDNASNGRSIRFTSSTSSAGSNGALHTIKANSTAGELAFANGNGNIMYLDSSGNVGIGTSSPAYLLSLEQSSPTLQLKTTNTSGTNTILFSDSASNFVGNIKYNHSDNSLSFATSSSSSERMRIDSSGNLLVGKTSSALGTEGIEARATGFIRATVDSADCLQLNRLSTDGDIIDFRKDGTTVGSIGTFGGDLTLGTGTTQLRFNDGLDIIIPSTGAAARDATIGLGSSTNRFKDLYLSGGVYLGGTGAANKLDDYEEGTFTPILLASAVNPSVTYGTRIGQYTKVGNVVNVYISLSTSAFSGGSGNLWVAGLPFAASQDSGGGAPMFYRVNSFTETAPFINSGTFYALFLGRDNTDTSTAWSVMQTSAWTSANPTLTQFQMTYFTDS